MPVPRRAGGAVPIASESSATAQSAIGRLTEASTSAPIDRSSLRFKLPRAVRRQRRRLDHAVSRASTAGSVQLTTVSIDRQVVPGDTREEILNGDKPGKIPVGFVLEHEIVGPRGGSLMRPTEAAVWARTRSRHR